MAASRDLGEFIRELRNNARISLRQLAQQTGVSNPYLSQIERGLRKPSAEVLQQIANALRVSTPLMYLRAGLLAEREGQGVLAAIAADPDLNDRHKKTLVEIYEAFRRENARARGEAAATAEAPVASETAASPSESAGGQPDEAQAEAAPVKPSRVVSKKAARRTASVKAGRTTMSATRGSERNDHKAPSRRSASAESAGSAERDDMP